MVDTTSRLPMAESSPLAMPSSMGRWEAPRSTSQWSASADRSARLTGGAEPVSATDAMWAPRRRGPHRADEQLDGALADVGLGRELDRTCKQISGGQQQRLSLFVAVIHDPKLLLLDGP